MGFRPSKAVEGGASFVGTVYSIKTGPFTYQTGQNTIGILIQFFDEGTGALRKYPDNYSVGNPERVQPNAAGTGFVFADESRKDEAYELSKGSNGYRFMEAAVKAGFPEDKMNVKGDENDIRFLDLARFEMSLTEIKTQNGTSKIMLPVKFLGHATARPEPRAEGEAATAPVVSPAVDADALRSELQNAVLVAVSQAGGSLPRVKLNPPVLAQFSDTQAKGAAAKLLIDNSFLTAIPGVKFDGKVFSIAQ
jgi:hypothetical protein